MDFKKLFVVVVCALLLGSPVLDRAGGTPPLEPPQVSWTRGYNGIANGSDYAKDIAVDSAGDVIVSGYAKNTGTDYDFVTRKYTPDGNTVWTKTYNRSGSYPDYAMAIAIDADSNIVVAGFSYNTTGGYDGIIVKYNSSGIQLWAKTYNYSGSSNDRFYDVAADANGNIYAVGKTGNNGLIVKYTPNGSIAWTKTYNGPANGGDYFYKLAIDSNGNVYACGESTGIGTGQNCLTLKYSPSGTLLWAKTYNGSANGWDLLEAIALDSAGNVYVTGSVETATDSNYVTIKYSPAGNLLWTAFYTATATGWDESYAIAVTSDSNIVVTGYSQSTTSVDAATVKYNSQTGSQLWATRYNGAGNSTDYAEAIATDRLGNVYIHGRSAETGSTNYLTICYDSNGMQRWKMNYNGPASLTDIGSAIASDNGIVYVTGCGMAADGTYDYATIRYTQHNYCPGDMTGDLNGDCTVNFFDFALLAESYVASQNDYLTLNDIADTWLECGFLIPEECFVATPATPDANSPQNLMVPPMGWDDTQIILIWSKPVDYSGVTDYRVYQNGTALGLSGRFDTTRPKLYYIVTGLIPNTTYTFTVKSVLSGTGESAAGNICVKTTANTPAVFYPETYGAAANGVTKDTAAIQAAINACTTGGKVHLRAGKTFLSGAIFLKSNMTLQIDGTLLGSNAIADYPYTSLRFPYYASGNNYMGLVNAYYDYTNPNSAGKPYGTITNVRICGSGVINGCQGYSASNPNTITGHGNTTLGAAEAALHEETNRGDMVTIKGVNQVYVGGWGGTLTLVYPAEHTIFISYCNGVTVADVNCDTYDIHNGDGINLCTSDTAYIFNSKFDTGDDCINMNAGQGQEGVDDGYPDQNIRVFDCSTDRGHGGYVIGSFTAAWVQDSLIEDCFFKNTDVSNGIGIRMKASPESGGGARRITCRDIRISGPSQQGILLNNSYTPSAGYTSAGPGQFSGNIFKNITVSSTGVSIFVNGLAGTPHTNNIFDHITGNKAASLNYCTNSTFSYITVTAWSPYTNCSGNINGGNNSPAPPF